MRNHWERDSLGIWAFFYITLFQEKINIETVFPFAGLVETDQENARSFPKRKELGGVPHSVTIKGQLLNLFQKMCQVPSEASRLHPGRLWARVQAGHNQYNPGRPAAQEGLAEISGPRPTPKLAQLRRS